MIWRKAISIKFFQSVNGTTWFPLTPMCFWNYSRELWRNDTFVVIFVKAITPSLTAPPHPSSLPHFSPLSSHLNLVTFLAYFHASILITHSSTRTSWRHFEPGTSLEDPLHSSHCRWRDSVFVTLGHRCHSGSPASDLWRFLHLHHSSPARHDTEAGFLHSSYWTST